MCIRDRPNFRGNKDLCKLSKEYLNDLLCTFNPFCLQHSKTFDISRAFLQVTNAKLSTLKQVRFFCDPPCNKLNVVARSVHPPSAPRSNLPPTQIPSPFPILPPFPSSFSFPFLFLSFLPFCCFPYPFLFPPVKSKTFWIQLEGLESVASSPRGVWSGAQVEIEFGGL